MALNIYAFFHLNLAFSSIEEDQRPAVIKSCYWPLLRLIEQYQLPIGIEATGLTLELIQNIDPAWIRLLADLTDPGPAEFVGSGYSQLIGPLVPAEVNTENQKIGLETYDRLLGFRPQLALVSEQAYSSGLVPIYKDVGYKAIIMEWDNPSSCREGWCPEWRYLPQLACAPDGEACPIIWNKSIPFQKFQRYAHNSMQLSEYLGYLRGHCGVEERAFALYGNDAEIFNFRPGRFQTEATLGNVDEWERIGHLFDTLAGDPDFTLIAPSQVLTFLEKPGAGNRLRLETARQPVPVKKQAKYNITRWALTGRGDLDINTRCWRLYGALQKMSNVSTGDWRELCYLWSSDFRTHITDSRWVGYLDRLSNMEKRLNVFWEDCSSLVRQESLRGLSEDFRVTREGDFLEIETSSQRIRLNCRRGLAIDGLWHHAVADLPLLVSLPHGYFDDIQFGADFYSGHLVFESARLHKISDLSAVMPVLGVDRGDLVVLATVATPFGDVKKEIRVPADRAELQLSYHLDWSRCENGALHLGFLTLNPNLFYQDSLFFQTHNGGSQLERFQIPEEGVNHLQPVSSLVTASQGVGATEGIVEIGDRKTVVSIEIEKEASALTGHVYCAPVNNSYLCRLVFSAMEVDDTSCRFESREMFSPRSIKLSIRSRKIA